MYPYSLAKMRAAEEAAKNQFYRRLTQGETTMNKPLRLELEDQMEEVVEKINAVKQEAETPPLLENVRKISEEIANVLTQSAENIVTEAQNQLEQTKLFVEKLRSEVKIKSDEHADLASRLKNFGSNVLEAHHRFHGDQ
jgi:hypothetical protein